MGIGYGANCAYVISTDRIRAIAPVEYEALVQSCIIEQEDMDYYLQQIAEGNESSIPRKIKEAYLHLVSTVFSVSAIDLEVEYHDSENRGDRYDDVDGVFWVVHNAFIPNPNIDHKGINKAYFVTLG